MIKNVIKYGKKKHKNLDFLVMSTLFVLVSKGGKHTKQALVVQY
jgi:hypothetical protein